MSNTAIILGCGGSAGVPSINNHPNGDWGSCDAQNSKNYRTRSSLYLEYEGTRILIDTSPDLRQQYLNNRLTGIDAVILTHAHSDHISGIHDLRSIFLNQNKKIIPVYSSAETFKYVRGSYDYLFTRQNPDTIYPIVLQQNIAQDEFYINSHKILTMVQPHGDTTSLGIRIGNLAYSTDFNQLSMDILNKLRGLDVWILDCLIAAESHFSHNTFDQAMSYIDIIKPKRAIFTHMSKYFDFEQCKKIIPPNKNVEPGYDGMVIDF